MLEAGVVAEVVAGVVAAGGIALGWVGAAGIFVGAIRSS
jgi:hypothetical protein